MNVVLFHLNVPDNTWNFILLGVSFVISIDDNKKKQHLFIIYGSFQ